MNRIYTIILKILKSKFIVNLIEVIFLSAIYFVIEKFLVYTPLVSLLAKLNRENALAIFCGINALVISIVVYMAGSFNDKTKVVKEILLSKTGIFDTIIFSIFSFCSLIIFFDRGYILFLSIILLFYVLRNAYKYNYISENEETVVNDFMDKKWLDFINKQFVYRERENQLYNNYKDNKIIQFFYFEKNNYECIDITANEECIISNYNLKKLNYIIERLNRIELQKNTMELKDNNTINKEDRKEEKNFELIIMRNIGSRCNLNDIILRLYYKDVEKDDLTSIITKLKECYEIDDIKSYKSSIQNLNKQFDFYVQLLKNRNLNELNNKFEFLIKINELIINKSKEKGGFNKSTAIMELTSIGGKIEIYTLIEENLRDLITIGIEEKSLEVQNHIINMLGKLMYSSLKNNDYLTFKIYLNLQVYLYYRVLETRDKKRIDNCVQRLCLEYHSVIICITDEQKDFSDFIALNFQNILMSLINIQEYHDSFEYANRSFEDIIQSTQNEYGYEYKTDEYRRGKKYYINKIFQTIKFGMYAYWLWNKINKNNNVNLNNIVDKYIKNNDIEQEYLNEIYLNSLNIEIQRFANWDDLEFKEKGKPFGGCISIETNDKLECLYAILVLQNNDKNITDMYVEEINKSVPQIKKFLGNMHNNSKYSMYDVDDDRYEKNIEKLEFIEKEALKVKEKRIIQAELDVDLINSFKNEFMNYYKNNSILLKIYHKKIKSEIKALNDSKFGASIVENRELFIPPEITNTYYSNWGENYAESIVNGEEKEFFEYLQREIKKCTNNIDEYINKTNDELIIISSIGIYKLMKKLKKVECSYDSEWDGYYKLNSKKIPIKHVKAEEKIIYIININKIPEIVFYNKISGEDTNLEKFKLDVIELKNNDKYKNKLIENGKNKWLDKFKTLEEKGNYLNGRILIEIFEKFEFSEPKEEFGIKYIEEK